KSSDPTRKPRAYASASQMRAAVNYGFARDTRRTPTWSYNSSTKKWCGNPAQCVRLSRYLRGLHIRKTRDGECATSSRAANASIMKRMHDSMLSWLKEHQNDPPHMNHRDPKDWGGRLKRFSTWLISLIAFRCLLRSCDVVNLTVSNLTTLPLSGNDTHIGIKPWASKTQQAGGECMSFPWNIHIILST
ncbi:hypothetical protein GG344DRAFT_56591, partial [Lentinula edodes]